MRKQTKLVAVLSAAALAFIMRKQTKLVAVLSAAALFAIGASMTSFAATAHWEQEGEDWVYLDKDGDKVTDTWKKSFQLVLLRQRRIHGKGHHRYLWF